MPVNQPPEQIEPASLNDYLEIMSKAVFQSGISWRVVDAKWEGTREAFDDFDVNKVANYDEYMIEKLTNDTRIIRNYRKIVAIKGNANRMIELDREFGSFRDYLRSQENFDDKLKMIKKDFKFMGPSGVYYFLYVVKEEVPPHEEFEAKYRK